MLLVLLVAGPARAGVPVDLPGTDDDPIAALSLLPEIVDAPLVEGIAVRGGDPAETKVLFDGFEVPTVVHDGHGPRSIFVRQGLSDLTVTRDGVDLGRGTTFVAITSSADPRRRLFQATPFDLLSGGTPFSWLAGAVRFRLEEGFSIDEVIHISGRLGSWKHVLSGVASASDDHMLFRMVERWTYRSGPWRFNAALSPMTFGDLRHGRDALDARVDVEHSAPAAGLRRVTWRFGIESLNSNWHHSGWSASTADLAGWLSATAVLAPHITATGGVRVDAFLRGHDVATEPRGSIEAAFDKVGVRLEAGAFRRPPQEYVWELADASLHPERTTEVSASVIYGSAVGRTTFGSRVTGYYIDRTHLIGLDPLGNLGNTGFGTSEGIEAMMWAERGSWSAYCGASVSTSTHHDYPRSAQRPANYDQPLRSDSMIRYRAKRWQLAARYSLSSGLPYTPVVESIYNTDTDSYQPLFGFTNTARLPYQHRLDVRADVRLNRRWSVFADIRNAYAASTALGYTYSHDYKTRLATTLPILPYVGLRGDL